MTLLLLFAGAGSTPPPVTDPRALVTVTDAATCLLALSDAATCVVTVSDAATCVLTLSDSAVAP